MNKKKIYLFIATFLGLLIGFVAGYYYVDNEAKDLLSQKDKQIAEVNSRLENVRLQYRAAEPQSSKRHKLQLLLQLLPLLLLQR